MDAQSPTTRRTPVTGVFVGLATLDLIQHVHQLPRPNAKATASWQELGGGPALNAAVTFAALGGQATLVTRLGTGVVASLIRADLELHAVHVLDLAQDSYSPAVSAIAVESSSGQRQIISTDAAAVPRPLGRLPTHVAELVAKADVALLDGHHPDLAAAALATLAQARPDVDGSRSSTPSSKSATHVSPKVPGESTNVGHRWGRGRPCGRRHGPRAVPVVLDAGRWKPPMAGLIPGCTDVVCSADFRLDGNLAGDDLLRELIARGAALAAVCDGPLPIRWRTGNPSSDGQVLVPVLERAVDTLGAGDILHGAYAWARAVQPDPVGQPTNADADAHQVQMPAATAHRCLRFAATVASLSCLHRGTRGWLAELDAAELPAVC
ncbi:MAG: PfkB family carbohydrate kinase [Micrococcales bacterium]|nr:PfkB family carbohydrate kinase [Micrococcales bacterium]